MSVRDTKNLPSSRREAIEGGHKGYFTGRPCKSGHIAPRYLSGICVDCGSASNVKNRLAHPERARQSSRDYMAKDSAKVVRRAWIERSREAQQKRVRAWNEANKERRRVVALQWREKNRDKVCATAKRGRQKDPARECAKVMRRHASKMNATPKWLSQDQHDEMLKIYRQASVTSAFFGARFHVDHVVPLRGAEVCGLHVPWNLQIIPAVENHRKSNRLT